MTCAACTVQHLVMTVRIMEHCVLMIFIFPASKRWLEADMKGE